MAMTDVEQRRKYAQDRAADPRTYFWRLIEQGPVDYEEGMEGNPTILCREDVEAALRNPALFSSVTTTQSDIMGSTEPVIPLNVDPPEHVRYRRLLDPLFAPRKMAGLRPAVAAHTNQLIDSFIERGSCDFSSELAVPLPCSTFLSLLGLPLDELEKLVRWKDVMIRADTLTPDPQDAKQLQFDTAMEVYGRFSSAMEERRSDPNDDLISYLLQAEIDGERLTDSEVLRTLFLLLAAGLDTVTISLQCIFSYLVAHPEARRLVVEHPESQSQVIEELLRWETPVQTVGRRVTADTEISGCPLHKDQLVSISLSSANIDPSNPAATSVDFARTDKRHLAFGGGVHRCLGSHLARMELQVVVEEWHRRIPDYDVAPGVELAWNGSALRGIDYLPLVWPAPA
jgi:cytochrome P450